MTFWQRLKHRITGRADDDIDRELQDHLDLEAEDQQANGLNTDDARYAALRAFGNTTMVREEVYVMNHIGWIETLGQSFRYALRVLRRSPGFTVTAVLSLALGIGINTAMFSIIHTVLLRGLPYPQPERVVTATRVDAGHHAVTIPEFEHWKQHSTTLASIAGHRGSGERQLTIGSSHEWVTALTVTSDFLRTLDVQPQLGREFNTDETRPTGPQAIVLSDGLWRRSFGGDRSILGRAVTIDGASYSVVGVLPAGFWFSQKADALVPLRPSGNLSDNGTNTTMLARLKDGVSLATAQAEMASVSESFKRTRIDAGSDQKRAASYRGLTLTPLQDQLVGDVRLNLLMLFAATALLLVIACSNLVTLLLTRFTSRQKELAVRLALGASRGRLITQFFVENLIIAALGAGAGLIAAQMVLTGLTAWIPFELPASAPIRLDGIVLAFTTAIAAATALGFTFVPLLSARKLDLQESLKTAGRSGAGSVRTRMRSVLIVTEVALSTTLLIGAGLLIQSLHRMYQERLGFTSESLITFQTPLAAERQRNGADRLNFARAMLERLSAVPGVEGVATVNVLPLTSWSNLPTQRDGRPDDSIGGMEVRIVSPAYFELMGIPVRRGRTFTESDAGASLPVVVVNETVARAWWQQDEPVGDRLQIGAFRGKTFMPDSARTVVGVVGDTKTTLTGDVRPTVYVPLMQTQELPASNFAWVVKSRGQAALGEALRRATLDIDPTQRVRELRLMDDIVASATARSRFNALLFGVFACAALLVAAIGVYGLVSFLVATRLHEVGTRMALGATRGDVLALFLKQGFALTIVGLGLGLAAAWVFSRWLSTLLYEVNARDATAFAGASLVLLLTSLAATYFPSRRAAKTNPMTALRCE